MATKSCVWLECPVVSLIVAGVLLVLSLLVGGATTSWRTHQKPAFDLGERTSGNRNEGHTVRIAGVSRWPNGQQEQIASEPPIKLVVIREGEGLIQTDRFR